MAKPSCDHDSGTHCIHASERKAYRSCKQRWHWNSREHLTPWAQAKPLEFGIAIHKAMEVFFDPEHWDELTNLEKLDRAIETFDQVNEDQRTRFIQSGVPGTDDYDERKILGAGMLRYYAERVHPVEDNLIIPVRTEISFQVPLYVPNTPQFIEMGTAGNPVECKNSPYCGQVHENPAPVTMNGRIDALFQHRKTGRYWLFDWKTAKVVATNDRFLQLDTQMLDYTAALILELNIPIDGVAYAEMKKAIPEAPAQNQKRHGGRLFSVNKLQSTEYSIALSTFKVYDTEAYEEGKYDDYLEYLKSEDAPVFHKRWYLRQSVPKMRKALEFAAIEAMEMVSPDLLIYPSTGRFNCPSCAFFEPCTMMFMGEDHDFILESDFTKGVLENDGNIQEE